jgi:hypothetical protein
MPKATNEHTTPNADLPALVRELARQGEASAAINDEILAGPGTQIGDEIIQQRLAVTDDAWWKTAEQIVVTPARSSAELRAKAEAVRLALLRCVLTGAGETIDDDIINSEMENRMAWSLARDLLEERRGPAQFCEFEEPLAQFKGLVALLGHMCTTDRVIREDEMSIVHTLAHRIYGDIESSCTNVSQEIDERAEEHEAEIAALNAKLDDAKAAKAAPGSVDDIKMAKAYWKFAAVAARNMLVACEEAGALPAGQPGAGEDRT